MADGKIFISYRRDDSAFAARLLFDRLSAHFGEENIFMDVEDLAPGVDFVSTIENAVGSCDVLIVIIGQQWLTVSDAKGQRRLDNPEDFVRLEIAAGLKRDVRVIPILVQDARMPGSRELPEALQHLARLNALEIRHERFNADADLLARAIDQYLKEGVEVRDRRATQEAARKQVEREEHAREAAQQEAHIAECLSTAQEALEREDWETARTNYQEVIRLQPDHSLAQAGLRTALEQLELARLYGQGLLYQNDGRLGQALRSFQQIQAKESGYKDVAERIVFIEAALAKRESEKPASIPILDRIRGLPACFQISGVLVLLIVVCGYSSLSWIKSLRTDGKPTPEKTSVGLSTEAPLATLADTQVPLPVQVITTDNAGQVSHLRMLEGLGGIESVAFSHDGGTLASGSADDTVRLWRVSDGSLLQTLEGHGFWVTTVAFAPDGTILASGSWDGTIYLWGVVGN